MSSYCDLTLFSDLKFAFKSIRLLYKIFDFVHTVSLLSFDVCQNFIDNFKGIWVAAAVKKESKNTMLRRRKVQISWGGVGGGWGEDYTNIDCLLLFLFYSILHTCKIWEGHGPPSPPGPPVSTSLLWFYHHASIEE